MTPRALKETIAYRYGFAVAAAGLGLVVRLLLGDWFPPGFPYLTFFPVIIVTTYFVGARPAVLCATLSGLAAWYFFIGPEQHFAFGPTTFVALGFFAFVVAVDIFFIDGMQRAVRQLSRERERYARLAESQDLLYRELHHRVSNNIQVVGALLRLQAAGVKDGDARHALQEAGGRIEVIAKIQRELHNRVGDPVPFRIFAQSLLNDANVAAGTQASVSIEGGELPLHSDQATPVTLVLLECFNNALEHAFAGGRDGAVAVRLDQDGADHVLTVRDNGAGPPEGFDPAKSTSLGLRIVRAMAGQLGGRFEMTRGDGWTTCRLTYPALIES
ncbi:sensor histidine kinase [Caulobacter sp.]|uniref:sensor histidine kinase n=1 Tax=Caulobacter sp. TaxID=78 RepID=UPI003BAA61CC